jgi:hypothetical protein
VHFRGLPPKAGKRGKTRTSEEGKRRKRKKRKKERKKERNESSSDRWGEKKRKGRKGEEENITPTAMAGQGLSTPLQNKKGKKKNERKIITRKEEQTQANVFC